MREKWLDLKAHGIRDKISTVIRQMENGEIKPGDVVYSSKDLKDVIFVEKPPESLLLEYHEIKRREGKYPPFSGEAKYRTFIGQICSAPVGCITTISKGIMFVEHEVKSHSSDSKKCADFLEYSARAIGFRVERTETTNGIKLIFFGDEQIDLDTFLVQICQNDFFIW